MIVIAFIQFLSFLTYFGLMVYVLTRNPKAQLNRACALVLFFFAIWCFFLIFAQNPYVTKGVARLGYNLAAFGWCGFASAVLWFSLVLTEKREILKKKYLYPCAAGEKLGCYGLTEAGAGSDPAGMRTTAVREGDEWVINGEKKFITNGNVASYAVIAAVTEKGKGYKGISSFVLDLENTPGFKVGRVEEKLGICASGTSELVFEDARVSAEALLGNEGEGFRQMLTTLDGGRIGIASQAIGIGRAVLEEALEYAKAREQFSKPISSFQAIQWKLADMATELDAAELLTLRAAWLEDHKRPFEKESAMAKMYASDAAMRASVEGVQILGGYGYCKEYPMERHMRDAKICQIYEGTNEIMRLVIARNLIR